MNKTMVKLGDICNIQSGGTPARKNLSYWQNGKIPWAKISDFSGKYTNFTEEKITDEGLANSSAKIFKKGTVLYSIYATLGETTILNIDAATNQAIVGFDIKDHNVFSEYLYYSLLSLKEYVKFIGRGTTQNNININILRNLEIPIVPLETQQKIVAKLDNLNLAIDKCKRLLELHDELIKSKFYEMFGDPIVNNKNIETKLLKDLSELITTGNTPKGGQENYVKKGIIFIRSQNVLKNKIDLEDTVYIDEETHESMKRSKVHYKDILITKTGRDYTENSSLGRAALYLGKNNSANLNGHVYLIRLKNTILPEYVVRILTSDAYRDYIRRVCVGGIDKRQINLEHVEKFPILYPPLPLQTQFAQYVEIVEASKTKIKELQSRIEYLKASYMQEFFA